MLVLSRKNGESLYIDGRIKVTVVKLKGTRVRLGIEAPDDVRVIRSELDDWSAVPSEATPSIAAVPPNEDPTVVDPSSAPTA